MVRLCCLLPLCLFLTACSAESPQSGSTDATQESTSGTTTEQPEPTKGDSNEGDESYPALYASANLPEYPHARLLDIGRQTTSIKDGLKLQLESEDDVQTIAKYFEAEMRKLEWEVPEPRVRMETTYMGRYTKGDLYFQILIAKPTAESPSKLTISYAQN